MPKPWVAAAHSSSRLLLSSNAVFSGRSTSSSRARSRSKANYCPEGHVVAWVQAVGEEVLVYVGPLLCLKRPHDRYHL